MKQVRCRDVGLDCDGVVQADTEAEALQMVAQHARNAHGVQDVRPEMAVKVKSLVTDEPAKP